jgi:hypothetical protein
MKYSLLVSLCFLPLAIIFIITKISLWLSSSASEVKYVKEDAKRPHGPYMDWDDKYKENDDLWNE